MSTVELTTRFPEIAVEMGARLEAATKIAAEMIADEARSRVPVNTGKLRDAIHIESDGFGDWKIVAGGGDAFYGNMVEFGTTYAPAHPFLIPALEARAVLAVETVQEALRRL